MKSKTKQITLFTAILLVGVLIGCYLTIYSLQGSTAYDTIKMTKPYHHEELIKELRQRNIDFHLNNDGSVAFRPEQSDLVDSIVMSVLKKYSNGINVRDSNYQELITAELAKENITFKAVNKGKDRWIMWHESDHQKVRMLLDLIHSRVYRKEDAVTP